MGIVLRKNSELVFYAGTISRTTTVDYSGKKRRPVKAGTKNFMNFLISVENVAMHLFTARLNGRWFIKERKFFGMFITILDGKF